MGEAKHRKEHDPEYGKPRPKMRGLILSSPGTAHIGANTFHGSGQLDKTDLRASLFYWDRLMWPTNNILNNMGDADSQFLESAGIMSRPRIVVWGDMASASVNAINQALVDAEAKEPGIWSIGEGVNSLSIADRWMVPRQGTRIELINAIPLPKDTVPLAEILDFKAKRRPELLAFRSYLEEMTQEINGSADSVDALSRKLKELDLACADLFKTTKEWQLPLYLSDLKVSMNTDFAKSIDMGTKAWGKLDDIGMSETAKIVGATLAGVSSLCSVKPDFKLQSIRRPTSPYKYLYLAQRELF
ncbi:DUF6236 family protein [Pseudomonas sp. A-R-19]|uniref:DUF6236 family protein n=1 Tax=Pseudomonas sp. A-R-19 TaxID=2832403 RepID=UPI001CBF05B5|nr:DUF6236 family protein [Pseudomonas sp. A-R-19]